MAKQNNMANWLLAAGMLVALAIPVLALVGMNLAVWVWLVPVAGLLYGASLWSTKANVTFFLATIALLLVGATFAVVPVLGATVNSIFSNLALLAGAVIALPAVKVIKDRAW